MRILTISTTLVVSMFLSLTSVIPEKPYPYESQISGVSIKFPGQPESEVNKRPEVHTEKLAYDDGKMEYTLELSKAIDISLMEKDLAKVGSRYDAAKKMAANFHGSKEGYTEGAKREDWKIKKFKGQMITFKGVRYDYHFRVIVLEDMVVHLAVKARSNPMGKSDYDDKAAMKFANSFRLK